MTPIWFQIICAVVTCAVAVLTIVITSKKSNQSDGEHSGQISSDLGYLKKGIDGIERRLDRQDERYLDLAQRVTATEASAKQAHHRIDALEGKEKK